MSYEQTSFSYIKMYVYLFECHFLSISKLSVPNILPFILQQCLSCTFVVNLFWCV